MRGDPPRTTIVIPAWQAEATIARTLASVRGQTCGDWEAIVIDDGSRDGTAAIVGRLAAEEPRIRLLRQPNRGASAARNAGLAQARGAWTLFLDADDTIDRRFLAQMHARLAGDPAADAVACGHVRLAADGAVLARYRAPALDRDPLAVCRRGPPVAMHAMLSRTAVLRRLGGFDEALATNEDWDLWWRMAQAGARFAVERRRLAQYRGRAASLTRDSAAMLRDTLAMLGRIDPAAAGGQSAGEALLWNGGMAIGGGGDARRLAALLPGPLVATDPARSIGALMEGLMLGAGRPYRALLPAWSSLAPRVEVLLAEAGGAAPGLTRGIEAAVIRTGRFTGSVRAGRTLGVMLGPRRLVAGIAREAGIERVVVKLPFVRPRGLLMLDLPLGDGLSGPALLRHLAARVAGRSA